SDDPENVGHPWPAARLRDRAADRANQRRRARHQPGDALPCPAEAAPARVDLDEVGGVEHGTPRQDLFDHAARAEAAARGRDRLAPRRRHSLALLQALERRRVRPLLARLVALFQRRRLDRELADEISAHIELAIADNLARGMSSQEAQRAAMTAFGGVVQTEEAYRDRRGFPLVESMWQDVRYTARSVRR